MSEETLTDQLEHLVAMLPEGAEKPVSISEIATRLNTNKRTITAWVAFLINHKGVPIGSRRSAPKSCGQLICIRGVTISTTTKKAATGVRLNTRSCFVTSLAAEVSRPMP